MRRSFKCGISLVTFMMLLGLCQGCGKTLSEDIPAENGNAVDVSEESADADNSGAEDKNDSEGNAALTEGDSDAESNTEKEDEETPEVPLKLRIENLSHYEYKEPDSYEALMSGSYELVELDDESKTAYPELDKSLKSFNNREEDDFLKSYNSYLSDARNWYDGLEDKEDFYECYIKKDIKILRADNKYLCIRVDEEDYMGGAHGSYGSGGYNYDTISGEELELKDIIPDIEKLQELVKDKLSEKYADLVTLDSLDNAVPQYLTGDANQGCSWFITPDGVDIYFGIYQLGSYASGTQTVSILYDENPELFVEGFCKQEDNYVKAIDTWDNITADVNGDGTADSFMIVPETDGYDWVNSLNFTVNGTESKIEVYGYDAAPYLVRVGGNTYIYVEMSSENDYRTIRAFKVNGDEVEKIGEYGGYITDKLPASNYESVWASYWKSAFTSPVDIYVGDIIQIFTTHTGIAGAYIDADGKLVITDDYYYAYQYGGSNTITCKKSVKADVIDKDTFETITEGVTVSSGDKFSVYGTKGEDTVDLMGADGKLYRFNIKSDDWPQTIDGVDIEELFDGIMFAG